MFRKAIIILLFLVSMCYAPVIKPPRGSILSHGNPYGISPPVAIWLSNEGAGGLVNDLSGNGLNGAFINSPAWRPGRFGPAIHTSAGDDSYVNIPDNPLLSFPTGGFSIIIRIKREQVAGVECVIGKYETSHREYFIVFATTTMNFQVYDESAGAYIGRKCTDDWFADLGWHQVAVTFDGGVTCAACKIFIDGVQRDTDDYQVGVFVAMEDRNGPFKIGAAPRFVVTEFTGLFDHVVVFNGALTAQQIGQLSINPFPWFKRDPIELWSIEEAPAEGGQVIFINFASMGYGFAGFGLILVMAIIRKLRDGK